MSEVHPVQHPVQLVGAGPGDPKLITLAGVLALSEADVVLHDRLVPPRLLRLARGAELIDVGKTPGGESATQESINDLLIEQARAGRRVVRLKGGDPFVFGRGGEEASALQTAGIAVEVVPGVSSATAAAAALGIPVTDRRIASVVTIVTGSEGDGGAPPIDWQAVARTGGTIVVMMGWRNFGEIAARLIAAGMSGDTPSAAIASAWTPSQRAVFAPLSKLGERGTALEPPVTVVIGHVTTLAAPPATVRRRVVVTRAAAQAEALVARLEALNLEPISLTTIAIQPADPGPIDAAVRRLPDGRYDIVALTSVNGAEQYRTALDRNSVDAAALSDLTVAAIGAATAEALESRGIRVDLTPQTFTSDGLAEALIGRGVEGLRILLPRAAQANPLLPQRLREAGAIVEEVALYHVVTPPADPLALAELSRGVDVVTLTSPSTAHGFVELASGVVDLDSVQTVCIGPVTAQAARELGLSVAKVAHEHTIDGLVRAVAQHAASLPPEE